MSPRPMNRTPPLLVSLRVVQGASHESVAADQDPPIVAVMDSAGFMMGGSAEARVCLS
jgi:hypothetical protein